MIEGLPWPTITAASGGWVLLGICLYGLITGRWWVTRREADAHHDEALRLRASNDRLQEQLGKTLTGIETMNEALTALKNAAEQRVGEQP